VKANRGELKKKVRFIGSHHVVPVLSLVSNRMRETNSEGNECWRFDLNYTSAKNTTVKIEFKIYCKYKIN
jgi:hypothetical protein